MKLVFIENVKSGMVTGEDIFREGDQTIPYLVKKTRLTDFMISELRRYKVKFVYIDEKATLARSGSFGGVKERYTHVPKPKPIVTPKIRNDAVGSLKNLFEIVSFNAADIHSSAAIIKHIDSVVEELVDSLINNSSALVNINDLKSYDEYTYHHSLSVAVIAIAIGQHLMLDKANLKGLGTSAILHDIGKTSVPIEIIQKTSKLNNEEFDIIKSHSPEGYKYLIDHTIGDDNIRAGVLSHHEKYDGTGYPHKLAANDIHLWAKIISVADVYDALTSHRPYRNPMQPNEAVEYIMGGVESSFDYDVVQAFIKKVELYPVASFVQLSNGRIAVVLNNNNPFRPVIRLVDTGDVVDLYNDRNMRNLVVLRTVPEQEIKSS